jgi:hypothetical protein
MQPLHSHRYVSAQLLSNKNQSEATFKVFMGNVSGLKSKEGVFSMYR